MASISGDDDAQKEEKEKYLRLMNIMLLESNIKINVANDDAMSDSEGALAVGILRKKIFNDFFTDMEDFEIFLKYCSVARMCLDYPRVLLLALHTKPLTRFTQLEKLDTSRHIRQDDKGVFCFFDELKREIDITPSNKDRKNLINAIQTIISNKGTSLEERKK